MRGECEFESECGGECEFESECGGECECGVSARVSARVSTHSLEELRR